MESASQLTTHEDNGQSHVDILAATFPSVCRRVGCQRGGCREVEADEVVDERKRASEGVTIALSAINAPSFDPRGRRRS